MWLEEAGGGSEERGASGNFVHSFLPVLTSFTALHTKWNDLLCPSLLLLARFLLNCRQPCNS